MITIPEKIYGDQGAAFIQAWSDSQFIYHTIVELEDLFINQIKKWYEASRAQNEINDDAIPKLLPAYHVGDRQDFSIVAEAGMTTLDATGLSNNAQEVEYQPDPDDATRVETYLVISGEASFQVDIYCRATSRLGVGAMADRVMVALFDPYIDVFSKANFKIPQAGLRFSGKPVPQTNPKADKASVFILTATVTGIRLPWARMYKQIGPTIDSIGYDITVENPLSING